jgi:TPR repeat protein
MTTLAYLIGANKLDNVLVKNKIFAYLNKAGAKRNIPVSMLNYAICLKNGKGVKRSIDKACEYYYKAINAGYLEARKQLDDFYD